jgi:hypothetical protein
MVARIRAAALAAGSPADGTRWRTAGRTGRPSTTWCVHEQLGRCTNGLWWWIPDAYNVSRAGTPEQIERYLEPSLRGEAAVVRGDRGARGLRPVRHRHHGAPRRRRLGDRRREVVRHERRRRRRARRRGERGRARPDAVHRRRRRAGIESWTIRRSPTRSRTGTRRSASPASGRARRACSAARRRRRAAAGLVRGGAARHRRALRGRDGRLLEEAVDWARPASRAAPDHRLPGRVVPARRLAADAPRPRLLRYEVARWPTRAPTRRWCTPRRRWRSCSPARPPTAAPTGAVQASVAAGYMRTNVARAVPPRAAGRPDLGGHQRDPAADREPVACNAAVSTPSSPEGRTGLRLPPDLAELRDRARGLADVIAGVRGPRASGTTGCPRPTMPRSPTRSRPRG